MSNLQKYNNVFNSIFNIQVMEMTQISVETIHAWNSITHLRLVSNIEDEFNVMFEPEDILEFKSYDLGIGILKKYGISF